MALPLVAAAAACLALPCQGARLRGQRLGLLRRGFHGGGLGGGFGGGPRLGCEAPLHLTRSPLIDGHHHQVWPVIERPKTTVPLADNPQHHAPTTGGGQGGRPALVRV